MSTLKCKMCGGTLEINENETTATCEYCGTEQTIPKITDDVIGNLFNRANTLRLKSEFDKAEEIYNKIVGLDNTQSEAYWGIILCKYGIEYVEDPTTYKRVPTCHRTSYDAITADEDYKLAIQYADISQKIIYEAEAKAIDEIQKGILTISQNEKPYDVFICYKETDESGKRTQDSVLANDIYHQLTQEGFKVFYAAITLEDKLGQEYEPYIFAALNSAKVMLVIGSKPEYFTAVWVKNEWSRYLKLMKGDRSKLLILCYKDMDAYELPEEFAHLQAQDMGKIGFINDIVRGIKKVINKDEPKSAVKETAAAGQAANSGVAPLLKRISLFLEDGNWQEADEYCERVLDSDPENAQAYLYKLMAKMEVRKTEDIKEKPKFFDQNDLYEKLLRFADDKLKKSLESYHEYAKNYKLYEYIIRKWQAAVTAEDYRKVADSFENLKDFKDSEEKVQMCLKKAEEIELEFEPCEHAKEALTQLRQYKKEEIAINEKIQTLHEDNDKYEKTEIRIHELTDSKKEFEKQIAEIKEKIHNLDLEFNSLSFIAVFRKKSITKSKEELNVQLNKISKKTKTIGEETAKNKALLETIKKHDDGEFKLLKDDLALLQKKAVDYKEKLYKIVEKMGNESGNIRLTIVNLKTELLFIFKEVYNYKNGKNLVGKLVKQYLDLYQPRADYGFVIGGYSWRILGFENDKLLLITENIIGKMPYHDKKNSKPTWETCSLRKYLNTEFYESFNDDEKAIICTTELVNRTLDNKYTREAEKEYEDDIERRRRYLQMYNQDIAVYDFRPKGGNNTFDNIFLLSIDEVNKYFGHSKQNRDAPGTGLWWLRSHGGRIDQAMYICGGEEDYEGASVSSNWGVRPAMWISLSDSDTE